MRSSRSNRSASVYDRGESNIPVRVSEYADGLSCGTVMAVSTR
jgi:hypothetical protein